MPDADTEPDDAPELLPLFEDEAPDDDEPADDPLPDDPDDGLPDDDELFVLELPVADHDAPSDDASASLYGSTVTKGSGFTVTDGVTAGKAVVKPAVGAGVSVVPGRPSIFCAT